MPSADAEFLFPLPGDGESGVNRRVPDGGGAGWEIPSMRENMLTLIQEMEERYARRGGELGGGIATGFAVLDEMTGGLRPGDLIVVAARPCLGKTAWILNVIREVALGQKLPVAFFSLDSCRSLISERLLATEARVPLWDLRQARLSPRRDFARIAQAAAQLAEMPLWVDDTAPMDIATLGDRVRYLRMRHGIRLLVVDHAELVGAGRSGARGSRLRGGAAVVSGLKELARELEVPVLVTASLNRSVERRGGGVPEMGDLWAGEEMAKCADVVAMLYREDVYEEVEEGEDALKHAMLLVCRNRLGPVGEVPLTFQKEWMRFVSREAREE